MAVPTFTMKVRMLWSIFNLKLKLIYENFAKTYLKKKEKENHGNSVVFAYGLSKQTT